MSSSRFVCPFLALHCSASFWHGSLQLTLVSPEMAQAVLYRRIHDILIVACGSELFPVHFGIMAWFGCVLL